jgi:hypothetical protein
MNALSYLPAAAGTLTSIGVVWWSYSHFNIQDRRFLRALVVELSISVGCLVVFLTVFLAGFALSQSAHQAEFVAAIRGQFATDAKIIMAAAIATHFSLRRRTNSPSRPIDTSRTRLCARV